MIAWGESLVLGNRIYCNHTKTSAERRAICLSSVRDVRYPGNTYPSDDLPYLYEISSLRVVAIEERYVDVEIKTDGNVVIHCSKSPWCVGGYRTGTARNAKFEFSRPQLRVEYSCLLRLSQLDGTRQYSDGSVSTMDDARMIDLPKQWRPKL